MTDQFHYDNEEQRERDGRHELLLRGLQEADPAEAYDAFVEAVGYPLRIGDQPERIQDTWEEFIDDDGSFDHR